MVGENIYKSTVAISQVLTGRNRRGVGRLVIIESWLMLQRMRSRHVKKNQ